jgi:hypothetical protein
VALPLLSYAPNSQNQRVAGYEVGGDEQPRVFTTENVLSSGDMENLIWAAYRQIYSEHQILKSNRQKSLESQLKFGQITVRDFIRGLATSAPFLERNYQTNSNYRFVEMCVQRVLGRDVYSDREKIAWSIVVATKGPQGFIVRLRYNTLPTAPNFASACWRGHTFQPENASLQRVPPLAAWLPANDLADKCSPFCSSRAASEGWRSVELFEYGSQYAYASYSAAARASG